MGHRKKTRADILSYATIIIATGLMSGMALGHITEESMHPRLPASAPVDPVERFGLGQNAYKTTNPPNRAIRGANPEYADANNEIGRYVNGARVLVPYEPARKIDRVRLERLQAWNDENFGPDADLEDESFKDAERDFADYQPIDVGAVETIAEATVQQTVLDAPVGDREAESKNITLDARADDAAGRDEIWAHAEE